MDTLPEMEVGLCDCTKKKEPFPSLERKYCRFHPRVNGRVHQPTISHRFETISMQCAPSAFDHTDTAPNHQVVRFSPDPSSWAQAQRRAARGSETSKSKKSNVLSSALVRASSPRGERESLGGGTREKRQMAGAPENPEKPGSRRQETTGMKHGLAAFLFLQMRVVTGRTSPMTLRHKKHPKTHWNYIALRRILL